MRFTILGSSSSGNAAVLQTSRTTVLIDAGFSARQLGVRLGEIGLSLDDVDAVFLTHEHGDHTAGMKGLSRRTNLPVFANYATARAVQDGLKRRVDWQLFETGASFAFRDCEITAFSVPHDAYDPVGFVFATGGEDLFHPRRSLGWVTDLGYVPRNVAEQVRGVDLLVLEANHEEHLLDDDPRRPWSVKQRIKGRHGHLSNDAACGFLGDSRNVRWEQVILGHLSKDCNRVDLLENRCAALGEVETRFQVNVVDPLNGVSPAIDW